MGVTGLDQYVTDCDLYKPFRIEKGKQVVIDGSALLRFLCKETVLYGGEYQSVYKTCGGFSLKWWLMLVSRWLLSWTGRGLMSN